MSFWDELKRPLYALARQDSRHASDIGRALNWDWLKNEGKENQRNPGRAVGKGAAAAATWYLGGPAWGTAANAAGSAAEVTAEQAAQQAAQQAVQQGLAQGGLFGLEQGAGLTTEQLAQQAIARAALEQAAQQAGGQTLAQGAEQGVGQGLSSGGLFEQVPGVTNGSPQWQALAQQNAGMGGQAWDSTSRAGMDAVKSAYGKGNMGTLDYLKNVGKADLSGMNDPSVWLSRAQANLGRMAGTAGKGMATRMAMNALSPPQQPGAAPPPMMPQQQQGPVPMAISDQDKKRLLEDYKSGRISEDELRRKLGIYS